MLPHRLCDQPNVAHGRLTLPSDRSLLAWHHQPGLLHLGQVNEPGGQPVEGKIPIHRWIVVYPEEPYLYGPLYLHGHVLSARR